MRRTQLTRKTPLYPIRRRKLKFSKYSKYKNKSQSCQQGHIHQSIGEARYCDSLAVLEKAGDIKSYKSQQMFDLIVNSKRITGHRVDFLVMNKKGKLEVHEVKGFPTDLWKIKMNLFEALYPDIPYIVVKI